MAEIKTLLDEYGIIHEGNRILPNDSLRLKFLDALAELEDNVCHKSRQYPKTRLHGSKVMKKPYTERTSTKYRVGDCTCSLTARRNSFI
jgi:hypothetical protein